MEKPSVPELHRDAAKAGSRYADVATKGRLKGESQEPRASSPAKGNRGTSSVSASGGQTQERRNFDPPKEGTRGAVKGMKKKKRR